MEQEYFMQQALALAQEAAVHGEVPVGCVIVRNGEIVGPGQCGAGQLAAGRVRPVCDAGALPHVRWGHS